jgi:hypothetical protein
MKLYSIAGPLLVVATGVNAGYGGMQYGDLFERADVGVEANRACQEAQPVTVEVQPVEYSEYIPHNTVIDPFRDGQLMTIENAPTHVVTCGELTRTISHNHTTTTTTTTSKWPQLFPVVPSRDSRSSGIDWATATTSPPATPSCMNELPQECQFNEAIAGDAVAIDIEGCRVALGPHAERVEVDQCLIAAAGPDGDEAIAVQCLTTYVVCSNNAISAQSQTATFAPNATASALGYLNATSNATSTPAAANESTSSSFAPLREFANATSTSTLLPLATSGFAALNATSTGFSTSSQLFNASLLTTTSAFGSLTSSAFATPTTTTSDFLPIDRRQAEVFECVPELPPICAGLAGKDPVTVTKYIPQCALALDQAANHPDAGTCLYGVETTSGTLTGDAFVACLNEAIVC